MSGIALPLMVSTGATAPANAQQVVNLPLEDRLLDAGFPEVYRIGDGVRDWELLTRVTSIGFDARGNLHIRDLAGGDLSVLVVDPRGELVVRFGQPGEGPGDFRDATHAFALPDGRTVVADDGHMAYQLFDAGGGLERWVRYPGVSEGETPPRFYVRSADPRVRKVDRWDGSILARVAIARRFEVDSTTREFDLQAGTGPRTVLRVRLDGDEASESEVARASRPDVEEDFHFAALPGGRVAFSDTTAYRIKVTDPAGVVDRVLVRSFTPRDWDDRTAEAFRDYLRTSIDEAMALGGDLAGLIGMFGGPSALRQQADDWEPENAIPHVAGLETTWDGTIWALRTPARGFVDVDYIGMFQTALASTPTGLTAAGPGPIDVITPDGEYLGTIPDSRLPNAFGPNGLVAYVTLDEYDVPTVAVRRVPEGIR
ncbi:MAG: hypothetical protein F4107_05815 [Gemmatimonadetes bacterium]|nr:hypothetical protein [Gemmatimonadota bacterium]MYD12080.1 hypothetical protein [Gemmatimonadota bacterium]MYI65448.1 hypothetical protein [Gemmatimonadota bacterium]